MAHSWIGIFQDGFPAEYARVKLVLQLRAGFRRLKERAKAEKEARRRGGASR